MHIPNGLIDPKMGFGFLGAAALVLGYCFSKVKEAITQVVPERALAAVGNAVATIGGKGKRVLTKIGEQKLTLMGMVASLIFVGQMFNFPVADGTSGHFLGGVFAAIVLGPFAGTIVMAVVLAVQSLFFADGGPMALGVNIINMGFIATFCVYYIYLLLKKFMPESLSVAVSAFLSIMAAAFACSVEIGFSETIPLNQIIPAMLKTHLLIGVGEAAITLILLALSKYILPNEE